MINNLVITDKAKLEAYGEHIGKEYKVYFSNISPELMYFSFNSRRQMEEFLYRHKFERYTYKSSNGNTIIKVWEYIQEKLDEYKEYPCNRKKLLPEKYSWDDWYCGHFIKEK